MDVEFQNEVKTLIHIIMENRNRCASGPVEATTSIPFHVLLVTATIARLKLDERN